MASIQQFAAKSQPAVTKSTLRKRAHARANANFWQPKPGDWIEGVVITINSNQGKFGSTHWHVQRDDGTVQIVSASPQSLLVGKLAGEHIEIGDRVYVELIGEKKSKSGSLYKDWAVASEKKSNNGAEPADDEIPH